MPTPDDAAGSEPLLPPSHPADEALDAFEDWAASNTTDDILIIPVVRSVE